MLFELSHPGQNLGKKTLRSQPIDKSVATVYFVILLVALVILFAIAHYAIVPLAQAFLSEFLFSIVCSVSIWLFKLVVGSIVAVYLFAVFFMPARKTAVQIFSNEEIS